MIRVKVVKYRKGAVISVGIDPFNPHELPVRIFYENKVVDPLIYAVTRSEISDADNAIYVRENEINRTINEIKEFYARYGEYFGMNIPVTIIEIDDRNMVQDTGTTVRKLKMNRKPRIKKLSIQEITGKNIPRAPDEGENKKTEVLGEVETTGIPVV